MKPILLLALLASAALAASDPAVLKSEFIFDPNPVPSCHASTIVEASDGSLVSAWFAGTAEGKPDVSIWTSRFEKTAWSAPVKVTDGAPHPCWNPVLFQPREGPLMLFYKVGPSPATWWGMLTTSADHGLTWSPAKRLPDGILGPIKNKPIQLADGTILCPTSTETTGKPSAWRLHFELSKDLGTTWTTSQPSSPGEPAIDAIQPSILFLGGSQLMALGRTRQKRVFTVTSPDNGATWGPVSLTSLPNPNSGTDAVTLKDGRHLLIYNPTERGRTPLSLALSQDGKTWQAALTLETEPGEYSYPAIIQTRDGLVHIAHTWKRKLVKHWVIDPAKLSLSALPN